MATGTERAYESLRKAILHGEFEPGAKLNEVALSDRLHISRTPVREALRQLASDGLVEVEPNRGARVVRWDEGDLADIFPLRALLEGYGAARAAVRRSEENLQRLDRLVGEMDSLEVRAGDDDAIAERTRLNNEFHREIIAASGSPRLELALSQLINVPLILRTYSVYSDAALTRSQQQHRDLLDAIRLGNPKWAESVMTAHILAAHEEIARHR